jgi:Ca2+/Na+ antiporter
MKKPIIIWIVAALFLFCSIPFFGQGSIVEGICGIAIAAVLGVFGYLTMKRTQAAAEAERKPKQSAKPKKRRDARNMQKRMNF